MIVQGDRSILLEVEQPGYEDARDFLALFAELEKAPEHVHFYRVNAISIWNAAAAGLEVDVLLNGLSVRSRFPLPPNLEADIREWFRRYGLLRLVRKDERLLLESEDAELLGELASARAVEKLLHDGPDGTFVVEEGARGLLKRELIQLGYPVDDLAGFRQGAELDEFALRTTTTSGERFDLRHYQREAAKVFWAGGSVRGGSGVVVLPCGAGKTIVGIAVVDLLRTHTLILTTNTVAVRQWRREILDKTTLGEEDVGEYSGETKRIAPITVATYQILTWRRSKDAEFEHFDVLGSHDWGLVIYDEVHLLPAPVFRMSAELQARRRLGLTATLVREDGCEDEVFSLIGPKRYEVPWKELESGGFIAEARCVEVRVPLTNSEQRSYLDATARSSFRIASCSDNKIEVLSDLLDQHKGGSGARDRPVSRPTPLSSQAFRLAAHHGPNAECRTRTPLFGVSRRNDHATLCVQGWELRDRPARCERCRSDLGFFWIAPRGGAASRSDPAAQAGWLRGGFLCDRRRCYEGSGLCRQAATVLG